MCSYPKAVVVFVAACVVSAAARASPPLVLEYQFNEAGTSAASTGSDTTRLNFRDSSGELADLHGSAGSGVSGLPGDRAFDNSASTEMGNFRPPPGTSPNVGGRGEHASDIGPTDGLASFTLQGWFRTATVNPIRSDAALINNTSATGGGWSLLADGQTNAHGVGNLALQVNAGTAYSGGAAGRTGPYNQVQSWVFFAVTYDGTVVPGVNNVRFYRGSLTTAVTLVSTQSLDVGAAADETGSVRVGNASASVIRPFDGMLDNLRLYGSHTDGSGVLSRAALEGLRVNDTTNTPAAPEPSGAALLLVAALAALGRRRRV